LPQSFFRKSSEGNLQTKSTMSLPIILEMSSPREQTRRSLGEQLDKAIELGLLRPSSMDLFEDDSCSDELMSISSRCNSIDRSRHSESEESSNSEDVSPRPIKSKILRRFNEYVAPNSPLFKKSSVIREHVGKIKKEARKQWRDRPRRTCHTIELIV